ncbi:hypothetical protein ACVWWN_006467 [Mycobacterium sp. URHB0021]
MKDEPATVLRPHLGEDVIVENLTALTGGASRTTWAFDAITSTGRRSLILRTGPLTTYTPAWNWRRRSSGARRPRALQSPTSLLPTVLLRCWAIRF